MEMPNSLHESNEKKRTELLQIKQVVNLLGSWEWNLKTNEVLWTDAMFNLRAMPIATNHLLTIEDRIQSVHPDDKEMLLDQYACLQQKQEVNFDYRILTAEGETKIIKAWAQLVKDENGEPVAIRGASQDVTREREAERRLTELTEIFQQAEEMANLANWEWNTHTGKLVFSSTLFKLLGCRPHEFEPSYDNLLRFVHPEDRQKLQMPGTLPGDKHSSATINFRVLKKDGAERHFRSIIKFFKSNNEELILGTVQDITDEVLLQKQLEEEKHFAQLLIENSIDLIAAYDTSGNIIAWNKASEEQLGLKKEDVLGKHYSQVFPRQNENRNAQDLQKALLGEFVYRTEEKSSVSANYYEYYYIPLKRSNGEMFGTLSISHNVTERKRYTDELNDLNRALENKNKELEKSNNELASFSYVASHDLQEPLRKIHTFSSRIQETENDVLSEQGKGYFKRMQQAALRMQTLIEDLLAFSRTTTNVRNFEEVNLNELVEGVKVTLKDSIEEKQAVIEYDKLPVASVIPFQFKQLLENLFLNAIKYSKPDVSPIIRITTEVIEGHETGINTAISNKKYYRINIIDNGIGFEQQYAEKIFELFQRLHSKHEYPGTGLGLAICKKIVENHYGFIYANSRPREGATFTILLPA